MQQIFAFLSNGHSLWKKQKRNSRLRKPIAVKSGGFDRLSYRTPKSPEKEKLPSLLTLPSPK